MKLPSRLITFTLAVALVATAGCGGPSPFTGRGTIAGMVTNAQQPLRVNVDGTTVATTTSSSGEFTLEGVPTGTVVLHFVGANVDVRLEISGVIEGQTLRITVRITPSGPVLIRAPNHVELTGTIQLILAGTVHVSGIAVATNSDTRFKQSGQAITFADLAIGQSVRVLGSLNANGQIAAQEIDVLVPPGANHVLIRGAIESISLPNLKISGLVIATDANTRFEDTSLNRLSVGEAIQVEGTLGADGVVMAQSIKAIDDDDDDD